MTHRLHEHARGGRLAVFAGAGLSAPAPTFLPSWWQVQAAVLEGLAEQVAPVVGEPRAGELGELLLERQKAEKLPPEYQAQILADRVGSAYFQVLAALDGEVPNNAHLALAAMAKEGALPAILTTNFDRLIETALRQLEVPHEVVASEAAFERLARELDGGAGRRDVCRLLKLHGSAEDPDTLIDTLAQRRVGLPAPVARCVRSYRQHHHWLFLGWSGLDLAAEPDYLGLRSGASEAAGFTWLVREGTEPRPEVESLAELYGGDRADLVRGELPGWLVDLARDAGAEPPLAGALPHEEVERRRHEVDEAVARHVRAWALARGVDACALALADLLRAAGRPEAGAELLVALIERTPADRQASEGHALALAGLGILRREQGDPQEAHRLFEQALRLFEQVGSARHLTTTRANLGLVTQLLGRHEEAVVVFRSIALERERAGDVRGLAEALHNEALSLFDLGRLDEAAALYRREIELATRCGDEVARAGALQSLAEVLARQNRLEEADRIFGQVLVFQTRLGDERGRAQALAGSGQARRLAGDLDQAVFLLHQALRIFDRIGAHGEGATTIGELARVALDRKDLREALRLFREELAIREEIGGELIPAKVRMNLGCVHILRDELDEARRLIEGAKAVFERLDARADLELARLNLEAIARRGRPGRY